MKKKIVCGMLCAAMSLSLLAGCGGGSDEGGKDAKKDGDAIKLGVLVYKYDDTYISTVRSAIEKYAKEADVEIKLDMQDGQGDQSKQNDQLDVLISKGVDALLINAVDTGSAQGLADKAKAADIPAVFFNREPAKEVVESCEGIFVGTTASEAGVMQGDMLADMYEADKEAIDKNGDGKIQYIVFKGEPGNPEAEARTEYAVKQAEERGLVMDNMGIEPLVANWMTDQAQTQMEAQMSANGDKIEAVFCNNVAYANQSGLDTWPPNMEYPSGVRVYDAYNPKARDIYWKYLNEGIFKLGMDGWWMDSTEPDHFDWKPEDFDTKTYLGSFRKVRNAYPLLTVGGVYDNQRAVTSDKRVFILTRSVFAGQQRYGANVWSGDIGSSWESLRNQIPAGLNFTLTGNPNFNSDIGGFFAGNYNKSWNDGSAPKNPMYQELYVRWLQFGTFTPMMRSHGADTPREIYQFGKKGESIYDAIEKMIHLRYALLPYIYSTSWEVTERQSSFMRALVMDFAADKKVWDIKDQYMFGKSILVAPIVNAQYTQEKLVKLKENDGWDKNNVQKFENKAPVDFMQAKSAKVYLPAGTTWYDFWTNEKYDGGQEIEKETTIDVIPLYVKAGSIIPMGPKVQYATEKPWDNLELRVYAGANGSFVLYEDEFDNYNYEQGAYTEIPVVWNDASRQLIIGARKGAYKGMLNNRKFTIVLQDGTRKVVDYKGKRVSVKF